MKLTFDQQTELARHERMNGFVNEIIYNQPGFDEPLLRAVRDYVRPLMNQYGFRSIESHLEVAAFEFYEAARDYKDEIIFVLEEHRRRFDPSWKHLLMSKVVADMTGYEYQTLMQLIKSNATE